MRRGFLCMLLSIGVGGAAAAQGYAKGVVPSDNLTRADAVLGWADVGSESFDFLTLGYEHRVTENWGLGAALTPFAYFDSDFGTGDFAVHSRFIEAEGDWHLGGSFALAGSTGELSAIGVGRFRVVPAFLVVRPWSEEDFTAFEAAWVEWLSEDSDFAVLTVEQGRRFGGGWFLVGALSLETTASDHDGGLGVGLEAGKQLDEHWQVALRPGYFFRDSGDPNLLMRAAYFF
jgi:hypothetical protein